MPESPSPFSGSRSFEYPSQDLEAMSAARNYYQWIIDFFTPYLGEYVMEVGAGVGNFCSLAVKMWGEHIRQYVALEPDTELYRQLVLRITEMDQEKVDCLMGFLSETTEAIRGKKIDTVIYVNVLEHVENDLEELKQAAEILEPGGHILTYSPARPELYSNMDRELGHYRRYRLPEMKQKMEEAGFRVVRSHYVDFPGYFLWGLKYRLLGTTTMEPAQVRLFDLLFVPILKRLEPSRFLPFGKNILAIGRKE